MAGPRQGLPASAIGYGAPTSETSEEGARLGGRALDLGLHWAIKAEAKTKHLKEALEKVEATQSITEVAKAVANIGLRWHSGSMDFKNFA